MKYPAQQLEQLKTILSQLAHHFDLHTVHPCDLHYIAWQQSQPTGKGHDHNIMYLVDNSNIMDAIKNNGGITRESYVAKAYMLMNGVTGLQRLVQPVEDFQLYPEGCNDNHVETAVKAALTLINL